ncbi:MAG: hypothetical protein KAI53_02150 [Candidatus Aenigmarchaeota archaeon]|nr:hypothetical protein [Candidatus Aenigmarchaeota archaeon]
MPTVVCKKCGAILFWDNKKQEQICPKCKNNLDITDVDMTMDVQKM